jgi:multiple sugar transport system permease protein
MMGKTNEQELLMSTQAAMLDGADVPKIPWYRRLTSDWLGYVLLAPTLLILLLMIAYPTVYFIGVSLFRWQGGAMKDFIWLGNFVRLFTDQQFLNSLRVTALFAICAVSIEFVLGLGMALFLRTNLKLRGLWRSLVIVPMTVTPVVIGIIWRLMYNPGFGVLNPILQFFGLESVDLLSTPFGAFLGVVILDVWNWTPVMFLILLAGLEGMPIEPFEAAKIDGAGPVRTFFDHTLPLLRPSILIALLIRTMDCVRMFDQVFILTQGGPGTSTEVVSLYLYKTAFKFYDVGYAAAGLFLLLIFVTLVSQLYIRLIRGKEETA